MAYEYDGSGQWLEPGTTGTAHSLLRIRTHIHWDKYRQLSRSSPNLDLDHKKQFWWRDKNANYTPTFLLKIDESDDIVWSAGYEGKGGDEHSTQDSWVWACMPNVMLASCKPKFQYLRHRCQLLKRQILIFSEINKISRWEPSGWCCPLSIIINIDFNTSLIKHL